MKILIVDDEDQNLYLLESLLKGSGYQVVSARNGVEALERLKQESIDMIISDILMPKMDGFQFCRECKGDDKLRMIPFVFYTAAYTEKKDEEFALSLGAEKFIIKPIEPNVFLTTLEGVIKEYTKGVVVAPKRPIREETVYLSVYNERLVRQLEKKMLNLEKANKALKESEQKYRELVDNANDAVIVIETTGYLSFVNPKFCEMMGYTMEEAKKLHFSKLVHPEDLAIVTENFKKTLSREEVPRNYEFRALTKLGKAIYVDHNFTVIEREGGAVKIQAVVRDVTERKRAEEELQESFEKIQKTMRGAIHAIGLIVEVRDPYTAGHQRRVTSLATAIAKEMGLSKDRIDGILLAGAIHDIGKISVPAEILSKPGRISDIEFSIIKTHPQVAHDILRTIEFPWAIGPIILQHHERIDGSGYPSGLSGEDIMLEARILGLADVIEAMASHRPYRPALGIDKALEEISQNKDILYDPNVVDACLKLFAEKGFTFE